MSGSHFSKLQIITYVVVGGSMFLVIVPLYFLAQAQALDYLKINFPHFYAWFVLPRTIIALELVGSGLLGFALVELWKQRKEKTDKKTVVQPKPEEKPATASAPAIGPIHFWNAPQMSQHTEQHAKPQAVAQQAQSTAVTRAAREPKPEPNIVRLPPRTAWIQLEESCYRERESTYTRAVIAVYENEVQEGKKTGGVDNVVAKITFSDERWQEFADLRVNEGCWINARTEVNFPRNARHELIIAIKENRGYHILKEIAKYDSIRNIKFQHQHLFVKVQLIAHEGIVRTDRYLLAATENDFSLEAL